jgi:hypothetical protein
MTKQTRKHDDGTRWCLMVPQQNTYYRQLPSMQNCRDHKQPLLMHHSCQTCTHATATHQALQPAQRHNTYYTSPTFPAQQHIDFSCSCCCWPCGPCCSWCRQLARRRRSLCIVVVAAQQLLQTSQQVLPLQATGTTHNTQTHIKAQLAGVCCGTLTQLSRQLPNCISHQLHAQLFTQTVQQHALCHILGWGRTPSAIAYSTE